VIRITTEPRGEDTLVRIDGQATESDLEEIRRVRKSAKGVVILNLRGLESCVPGGVELLRTWLAAGAQLQDATPFLEMMLKDSSSAPATQIKKSP
jgi:hypothetical protein